MRYLLKALVLSVSFGFAQDIDIQLEDVNIVKKEQGGDTIDYNRLRADLTLEFEEYENIFAKFIVDNENSYNTSKNNNENKTTLYRGYIKYIGKKNLLSLGRQRIPFGVGRIWNPIDIFNPVDSTAIEPGNRKGTDSLRYEYAMSELSNIDATVSKDKYALRIKGYTGFGDTALVVLKDNGNDTKTYGYEYSGELLDTKVELRSEGGYKVLKNGKDHFDAIVGAEYSFENSLTLLGEYRYKGLNRTDYLGTSLSYELTPLLATSFLTIYNFDDKSSFNTLQFSYSLADDITLDLGGLFYGGSSSSEFGEFNNSCFARFFIHF